MVIRNLYLSRIRPFYNSEMIKVLTGIRRCGKSTIMKQIIDELKESGISDDHIIYINFENYKFRKLCNPDALYEYIKEQIFDEKKYYLLIDEIQNVNEFELVINSFRATNDVSIFITESNAKELSGELATHLNGRTVSFRIMPFNFREFCEFKKQNSENGTYEEWLTEYMKWGGFPLVCKENDMTSKEILLSNIYDYLKYISDACICDKVPRYDIRGKKFLSHEEKTYVCDPMSFR